MKVPASTKRRHTKAEFARRGDALVGSKVRADKGTFYFSRSVASVPNRPMCTSHASPPPLFPGRGGGVQKGKQSSAPYRQPTTPPSVMVRPVQPFFAAFPMPRWCEQVAQVASGYPKYRWRNGLLRRPTRASWPKCTGRPRRVFEAHQLAPPCQRVELIRLLGGPRRPDARYAQPRPPRCL
jgi:hypothetical protein